MQHAKTNLLASLDLKLLKFKVEVIIYIYTYIYAKVLNIYSNK